MYTKRDIEILEINSTMLGQIAELVIADCAEPETTTIEAVQSIMDDRDSETRWANHYHQKLMKARKLGYLPQGFEF